MTTNRQIYQIGKIKKLIDLNGDTTNFDISFRVSSRNKEPFNLLVVDQTTLDNTPNLEYKKIENGTISGNIVQDKNIYQNYFLILKSENPCECEVEITKKELPKKIPPPPTQPQTNTISSLKSNKNSTNTGGISFTKILLIIGAIVALGIAFYLYSKKSSVIPPKNEVERIASSPEAGFRFYSPPQKSSMSHPSPSPPSKTENNHQKGGDLLERLKRLNLN